MGNGLRHKLEELRSSDNSEQEIDNIEGIYWSRKSLADIEKLAEAINDTCIRRSIGIVAPQGGGKSVLLKELRNRCVRRSLVIDFEPGILQPDTGAFEDANIEVLFMENCQHLFSRRIGGYNGLQTFLDWIATTGKTVVATWNLFSWQYLREAMKIDQYFPTVYEIPPLTQGEMAELLIWRYGGELEYMEDDQNLVIGQKKENPEAVNGKKAKSVPPRTTANSDTKESEEGEGTEATKAVAKDIIELSCGYPGIAFNIFDACYEPPKFHTRNLKLLHATIDLNFYEQFLLLSILEHHTCDYNELQKISRDKKTLDLALFRMQQQGLVEKSGDKLYSMNTIMICSVVEKLKKARLVW